MAQRRDENNERDAQGCDPAGRADHAPQNTPEDHPRRPYYTSDDDWTSDRYEHGAGPGDGRSAPEPGRGSSPADARHTSAGRDFGPRGSPDQGHAENYGNVEEGRYGAYGYSGSPGHQGSPGDRSKADEGHGAASYRGLGPKGYTRSDERIRELICERLTEDPAIDPSDITVEVADGVVTLTGTVDSRRAKYEIEEIAENGGARDIRNNLCIEAPARPDAPQSQSRERDEEPSHSRQPHRQKTERTIEVVGKKIGASPGSGHDAPNNAAEVAWRLDREG